MNIIFDLEQLSSPAEPLEFLTESGAKTEEGLDIISKIKELMLTDESIVALSAPQIGINKRIFCLRFNDQIKTFINPIITKKKGMNIVVETCPSMPGKEIVIGRPEEITAVYYNEDFKYEDNKLLGAAASLFDQQAQLLDGVLPSELGLVSDIQTDGKIEEEDIPEIVSFYKNTFLPSRLNHLKSLIDSDDDVAKIFNTLKFSEGVINGRIAVVEPDTDTSKRAEAKKAAKRAIISFNKHEQMTQKQNFKNYVKNISKKAHK